MPGARKVDGVEMKADKSGMNRAWKSEGLANKAKKREEGASTLGAKRGRTDSSISTRGRGGSGMRTRGSSDKKRPKF